MIQNHRALRTFVNKQQFLSSEKNSLTDLPRINTFFNGIAFNEIRKKTDSDNAKRVFDAACNEILNGNLQTEQKKHYREFLRLYLHQHGIFHRNVKFTIAMLDEKSYSVLNSATEYKINIYLKNKDLYIEDEFFIKKLIKDLDFPMIENKKKGYLIHGKTQFKLKIIKQKGCLSSKLVLLRSTLDCTNPFFKKLLDDRNFLQKLIDFLRTIFRASINTSIKLFTFSDLPTQETELPKEKTRKNPTMAYSA